MMNRKVAHALCAILLLVLLPGVLSAQKEAPETKWMPPPPDPKSMDWIKLKSGEWLRGEIKYLRDDDIEFDSEELDLLKLDFDDITELRSPRTLEYVFEDGQTAIGTAIIKDGLVRVRAGLQVREFQRDDLLSIIVGAKNEWDHWSGKVSVGFVGRTGNTNQTDFNSLIFLRREAARHRLDFNYNGNFGEVDSLQTISNHLANVKWDIYLSKGLFVSPAALELYSDKFQNIKLRTTVAAGLGWVFLETGRAEWYIQLFGGYLRTEYRSVEEGVDPVDESGTAIPSTNLDWDPTPDLETNFSYNATIALDDPRNTFHHFEAFVDIDIYGMLDFTISFTWDRNENPQATEDGDVPKRDDFRTAFGLGIDF